MNSLQHELTAQDAASAEAVENDGAFLYLGLLELKQRLIIGLAMVWKTDGPSVAHQLRRAPYSRRAALMDEMRHASRLRQ